jgi:hypothetical protein
MRRANRTERFTAAFSLAALSLAMCASGSLAGDPFKLGVEEKGYLQDPLQGGAQYPAPHMIQQTATPGAYQQRPPMQGGVQQRPPLQGNAQQRPPLQTGVQERVVLPPNFLGLWNVQGQRTKVEAENPEFQQQASGAFQAGTSNVWEISGDPNSGYLLGSNTGVKTPIVVDKVQGSTAFIRYQHPVGKTMAQEAIVMSLLPGGAQFNGLERITIVKQNEPPRCRVTYQLVGHRQR